MHRLCILFILLWDFAQAENCIVNPIKINRSEIMDAPPHLYIIVSPEVWEKSLQMGRLTLPSHHDQFIHLATKDQIAHVTQKFWSESDHLILKIETKKMSGRLAYETNPGGSNKYYHLYDGVIPIDSIVETSFVKSTAP